MKNNESMRALLSGLSTEMSPENLQLSVMQGMIAAEISMKRQELGWSQKELAARLGVTQGLVSRWERGEANFNLSTLVKIASALGLKMQSPIMPSSPISYAVGHSNIYYITTSPNSWSTGSDSTDSQFTSSHRDTLELEEM